MFDFPYLVIPPALPAIVSIQKTHIYVTLQPEFRGVEFMRYCPLNKNSHVAAAVSA